MRPLNICFKKTHETTEPKAENIKHQENCNGQWLHQNIVRKQVLRAVA